MTDAIAATHAELRQIERELAATKAERQRAQYACEQMGKRVADLESVLRDVVAAWRNGDAVGGHEAIGRAEELLGS